MEASWRAEATNLQDLWYHHGQYLYSRMGEVGLKLSCAALRCAVRCCAVYIQNQLVALQALIQGREIDAIWGRSHGRKAQQAMRRSL